MTRAGFLMISAFLAALAAPAWASECPAPVAPTGELAPWTGPVPLSSASDAAHLSHSAIRPGQAVTLALHPADRVAFPAPPGKSGGNGGLAELTIAEAGTYRVALGTSAWIDLMHGGKAVASIAHGHGAPCTGIRKIVDFPLEPGRYVLAISANQDARTQVLVAKKP